MFLNEMQKMLYEPLVIFINRSKRYGKYIILTILFLLLFIADRPTYGAIYYVAISGNDANLGTLDKPFLTVDKALSVVVPGDTINVASGTYSGTANTDISGTENSPITITGPSDKTAIITGKWTIDQSYYIIRNFHFNNYVILSGTTANYNVIDRNKWSNATQGVYMQQGKASEDGTDGPSYNTISNNECTTMIGNGCVVTIGTGNIIVSNNFHDLGGWDALRIWGIGTTIRGNIFRNLINGTEAGHSNHADIIQTFETSTGFKAQDIIFENNTIIDCTCQFGVLEGEPGMTNLSRWTFRNNLSIRSRLTLFVTIPYCFIYNNTFYHNAGETGILFRSGVTRQSANYGQVYNNLFIQCDDYFAFSSELTGSEHDYNIVTSSTDGAVSGLSETHGVNGGYTPSQIFLDYENENFQLSFSGPAVNKGKTIVSVKTDKNSQDRTSKSAYDIGAYYINTIIKTPSGLRIVSE